jgi:hypothetical protein
MAPGSYVPGYRLERRLCGDVPDLTVDVPSTPTAYLDGAVAPGTCYGYRLYSRNAAGLSAPTAEVLVTTVDLPAAPSGLQAQVQPDNSLALSWTAPADNGSPLLGYRIERASPSGGNFVLLVDNTGALAVDYIDLAVAASTEYQYRVSAINGLGVGPASASVTVSTRRVTGTVCVGNDDCATGFCEDGVCCGSACPGSCAVCDSPSSPGQCLLATDGDEGAPSCAPYFCDGSAGSCPSTCGADTDCVSTSRCVGGVCEGKKDLGADCATDVECLSSVCVDGVCCGSACAGNCARCDVAGIEGSCVVLGDGAIPDDGCAYRCTGDAVSCPSTCTTTADCISTHFCDGGTCAPTFVDAAACASDEQCTSGFCADGLCCDRACAEACDACDQLGFEGTCIDVPAGDLGDPSCAPYVCSGDSDVCPQSCIDDSNCESSAYCQQGLCAAKVADGTSCSAANQCASGFCVDGVCCDSACDQACDACNTAGAPGVCSVVAAGTAAAACEPFVCDGAASSCPDSCTDDSACIAGAYCEQGTCAPQLTAGTACSAANQCGSGFCIDGVCCDSVCDQACDACNTAGAPGICSVVAAGTAVTACEPFVCDGAGLSCPTACTDDSGCIAGTVCSEGACLVPSTTVGGGGCRTTSSQATWFLALLILLGLTRRRPGAMVLHRRAQD